MNLIKSFFTSLLIYAGLPVKQNKIKETSPQVLLFSLIVVGAFNGVIWWLIYKLLSRFNIPIMVLTTIIMLFPLWITRYLHIEGYIETSSIILSKKAGYKDKEHYLNFGIISAAIILIVNFVSIYQFVKVNDTPKLLFFIPIISRELSVLAIFLFPSLSAENSGAKNSSKKAEYAVILMVLFIITIIFCITLTSVRGSILSVAMLCGFLIATIKSKSNCEISGDTTGYAIMISETFGLFSLALFYF